MAIDRSSAVQDVDPAALGSKLRSQRAVFEIAAPAKQP
jgi:hypothetical protein